LYGFLRFREESIKYFIIAKKILQI
jgi:hypothetical protein